jgi:hypothetical protein
VSWWRKQLAISDAAENLGTRAQGMMTSGAVKLNFLSFSIRAVLWHGKDRGPTWRGGEVVKQ